MPIGIADILRNDLILNHIPVSREGSFETNFSEVPYEIAHVLKNTDRTPGNVALLSHAPCNKLSNYITKFPQNSFIKIAYSMIESTEIPTEWVKIFNEKFDLVAVPDEFLVSVYLNSGVTIPIFILPHGIYVDNFLKEPIKKLLQRYFFLA